MESHASGAASLTLPCLNCGYARHGLSPVIACPECGSQRALPTGSEAWIYTASSGLFILSWAIPLWVLAWASPWIFHTASQNGTMSIVSNRAWLIVVIACAAFIGQRRVLLCAEATATARWSLRLGITVVIAATLDASRFFDRSLPLMSLLNAPLKGYFSTMLEASLVILAVCWVNVSGRVFGSLCQSIGLPRVAQRLRWITLVLSLGVVPTTLWITLGRDIMNQLFNSASGSDPSMHRLRSNVYASMEFTEQVQTLSITLLAAACAYSVLQARHQLQLLRTTLNSPPR